VIQDADLTPSTISPTAMVMDPLFVGEGSSIGSQTVVMGPTFIGSQCVIGEKSVVNDCIVMSHARIGAHVHLNGCVVGEGVTIEDNAEHMGVVLAKGHRHKTVKVPYLNAASEGRERPALSSVLGFTRTYPIGKRVFDIFAASVGLILSAPLMLIIAVVLKAADGGPVLFKQRRCTQYGRFFEMYKFRTMVVDAEEIRATMQCLNEVDGPMFKIADDPRVTPIGVVLRRTYLDELPQLWNVLRGDMALVGPRPLSMSEMSLNPRWRDFRLAVRPGLTGLWQVESHSKSSFAEWIRHDIHYVCNFSPWLDLKILLKTALNVFKSLFLRSSKPSGDARTVTGEVSGSEDRTPPLENVQFELSEMTHEEKAVIPAAGDLTGRELAQGPSRTDNAYRGRIL
jgi:lipopolysaccharide/colanic/teichoic acid biosynthesis glycosyltransferase